MTTTTPTRPGTVRGLVGVLADLPEFADLIATIERERDAISTRLASPQPLDWAEYVGKCGEVRGLNRVLVAFESANKAKANTGAST